MDSRFANAWFLGRWTVYGYRLKPYCLLHSMQLEAIQSPLECGGEFLPIHLIMAAQICSSHEVLTEHSDLPGAPGEFDFDEEFAKWQAYIAESCSRPALYTRPETPAGGHTLNAPWQQIIVTYLIRNTSIGRMEAWTLPEGQALWEYHSLREQLGDSSDILSEAAEREMEEQAREEKEKAGEYERIKRALLWREEQITAGLWPRTSTGAPEPFDPANPDHFPPE